MHPRCDLRTQCRSMSNAAPQDFLPRASPTRQRQLRLISSVAYPSGLAGETAHDALVDHHQAVPVLGCQELLFVDPTTRLLSLGCQEQGSDGRATLRRIVVLSGPDRTCASIFSGAVGPGGGIRVVAGYNSRLFLFCVAADIISAWRRGARRADPSRDADGAASGRLRAEGAWPVVMRGLELGQVNKLAGLALTQGQDVQVWAFSGENKAYIYGVHSDRESGDVDVQEKLLLRDGTVVDAKDADGDVFMTDTLADTDETVVPTSVAEAPSVQDTRRCVGDTESVMESSDHVGGTGVEKSSSSSSPISTSDDDADPSFPRSPPSSSSEASTEDGDDDEMFFSPVGANPSRSMARFVEARYPHVARPCEPTATIVAVAAARYERHSPVASSSSPSSSPSSSSHATPTPTLTSTPTLAANVPAGAGGHDDDDDDDEKLLQVRVHISSSSGEQIFGLLRR